VLDGVQEVHRITETPKPAAVCRTTPSPISDGIGGDRSS
jgi:hypothetical protein